MSASPPPVPPESEATISTEATAAAAPARRESRLPAIVIAAVTFLVAVSAIGNWPVGVFQDDGIYLILAKSLAQGEGYRYLNLPGTPNATHYPPGYPVLLALLWLINPRFPQNVGFFLFANAAFMALAAAGSYLFARRCLKISAIGSAGTALLTMTSVPMLVISVFILSEPLFLALLFPVLFTCERAARSGTTRDAVIAGVAGGALALVRTLGIVAIPATAIVLAWRRQWRAAALVVVAGAIVLTPWQVWVAAYAGDVPHLLQGKYGSYSGWLAEGVRDGGIDFVIGVVRKNFTMLRSLGWTMFSGELNHSIIRDVIVAIACILLLLGYRQLARRAPTVAWFMLGYIVLVMTWPFEPTRFLWAILPCFGILFALASREAERSALRWSAGAARASRISANVGLAVIVLGFADYSRRGVQNRWWDAIPRAIAERATPTVKWIAANTRPSDLLLTDDETIVYLYTGRRAVPIGTFTPQEYLTPQTVDFVRDKLAGFLELYRADYVMASTGFGMMGAQELKDRTPGLKLMGALKSGAVYLPVYSPTRK